VVEVDWARAGLESAGFEGFVRFSELPVSDVPTDPGVYVVMRTCAEGRAFLARSVAGHFKGIDPTVSIELLEEKWVVGADVVYIGKAAWGKKHNGIRRRLSEFRRYGAGRNVGHRGGEYIWQLADHTELVVCWKVMPDSLVKSSETALILDFRREYGTRPFANRTE